MASPDRPTHRPTHPPTRCNVARLPLFACVLPLFIQYVCVSPPGLGQFLQKGGGGEAHKTYVLLALLVDLVD